MIDTLGTPTTLLGDAGMQVRLLSKPLNNAASNR